MKSFFKSRLIKANSGFSLVELAVIIAIISVSLIIAIPTYHLTMKPTAELNGASRQLFSDVQLARLRAVSENVRHGLDFDYEDYDYIVFKDRNGNYKYDDGVGNIVKRVKFSGFGYSSVSFDTGYGGGDGVTFDTGGGIVNSFSFSTRGLPWPGGSVYLINNKGKARTIVVNNMGGVRIEK